MKKQIIIFITAMVLVFAMACGATFAYLWSMAGDVTNTFVSGGFGVLSLQEVDDDGDKNIAWFTGTKTGDNYTNSYDVVPGVDIEKDPQVKFTFNSNSVVTGAYIFVKIEFPTGAALKDTNNCWNYATGTPINGKITAKINGVDALTIILGNNWRALNAAKDGSIVLTYCTNGGSVASITKASNPLANGLSLFMAIDANGKTIEVSDALTEADLKVFNGKKANYSLSISAYAIQKDGLAAADAWTKVSTMN